MKTIQSIATRLSFSVASHWYYFLKDLAETLRAILEVRRPEGFTCAMRIFTEYHSVKNNNGTILLKNSSESDRITIACASSPRRVVLLFLPNSKEPSGSIMARFVTENGTCEPDQGGVILTMNRQHLGTEEFACAITKWLHAEEKPNKELFETKK